ncbi:Cytoskeletal signaling protein slm1 [Leucoagaricus sp. SymC.cos]|nr:Cytoskeletal signaling protein slm1 [Leucoagaricus sp. SymC.cos]
MTKLAGIIQVPFRSGNQFLGEGGLQDVFYGIRDKTRQIADQHADLGRTIDSSIVQHLQKLLVEIKAHLKNVQNDTAKLASSVAKERETSTKLIGELANDISMFRNTPMTLRAKSDPYLGNQAVFQQLQKQVLEENLLQKSIIVMQQNSAHFETGIVRAIQSAWQTFDEWLARASSSNQETYRSLSAHMASLPADLEWISFAARSDHLLDPETPLRDPAFITYPCKDDPSVFAVHTVVLTPAGFLHAFNTSDPSHPSGHGLNPIFSLFLPDCTLGPPSSPSSKSHKFHIEGRRDGTGTTKSGSLRGLLGGDNAVAWSFRARSREEMMEWWNDLRMLCARYLIASEQIERSGPVEAAVRAAGYEDESEGSSVEEEEEAETYRETTVVTRPPGYAYEKGYQEVEMGPHGYVKNGDPTYDTHGIHAHPSVRAQEKAPAGHISHGYYDTTTTEGATAGLGQDTVQVAPQTTGASYDAPRSPKVIQATGYVPDELGLEEGYVGHHAHDPHHFAQTQRSLSPQHTGGGVRTESPRGIDLPRGGPGRLSPAQHQYGETLSPRQSVQGSPRQMPSTFSPRAEGARSPVYATEDVPTAQRESVAVDDGTTAAPVTTSYTGEEYGREQ